MKNLQNKFIEVVADYINDYGVDGLLAELFPNRDPSEIFWDMYEAGMIPDDMMERFLNDE